ncbi:MAG: Na/Pi cotransporter family protein [Clostridia bacterium]|nr:Na/Pi cotransporter family protein [Clostridia bacterium]
MFFTVIRLFGGLAMFLYGMRLMGDNLKESSSSAFKKIMGRITSNPFKAFLLGMLLTALIQSSKATIVITSGLVAAGIITLDQSLGIIVGSNVGTTVTGQIIRLLDVQADAGSFLQLFQPSTLAPIALIAGIALIMFCKFEKSNSFGAIAIGFGILFSGLISMTDAVNGLKSSGFIVTAFERFSNAPLLAAVAGAVIAFILQSSSASVGILQAFALTGSITFDALWPMLLGIYLGECCTTAIMCAIGAREDSRRVGLVNVLFNIAKILLVLVGVLVATKTGWLDGIRSGALNSGDIANTHTVFNLICAVVLLPFVTGFAKLSRRIIKDAPKPPVRYQEAIDGLNPVFFTSPALAFNSVYALLETMYKATYANITRAFNLLVDWSDDCFKTVEAEEEAIDNLTDNVSNYLVKLSGHLKTDQDMALHNHYSHLTTQFERLGDHAMNIAEEAEKLHKGEIRVTEAGKKELVVLRELLRETFSHTKLAFENMSEDDAVFIEPLEEVADDMIACFHDNHLDRMRKGACTVAADAVYLNILSDAERISDICSNIGISVVSCLHPEISDRSHSYIKALHQGNDPKFNERYSNARKHYFDMLETADANWKAPVRELPNTEPVCCPAE